MKLTVVGCSGSIAGPESPASCYLVEADGFRMVLDLGSGALGHLQRYCGYGELDAVLISHLHPDHCIDLLGLHVARAYGGTGFPRLPVYAPAGASEQLAGAAGRRHGSAFETQFGFTDWSAGAQRVWPFRVTVARVAHPVPTWAMRIEHRGRSLLYSADTGVCERLVELGRGADLALVEAAFQDGKDEDAPAGLHLNGREAGEHARAAGARRLIVTHVPPWNDPDVIVKAAREAYGGPAELATAGATFEV